MSTLSDQELMVAGLFTGAVLIVTLVVSLLYYVITALGLGRMFQKAGEPAWKAWIPVYNLYILFKCCWNAKMFWIWLAVDACGMIINGLNSDHLILTLIAAILGIAAIVIMALNCGRAGAGGRYRPGRGRYSGRGGQGTGAGSRRTRGKRGELRLLCRGYRCFHGGAAGGKHACQYDRNPPEPWLYMGKL